MRDEPTGLSLDIIDDVLVARVQHHSFRQDLSQWRISFGLLLQ